MSRHIAGAMTAVIRGVTGVMSKWQGIATRAQIAAALDDNICRCGSHNRIIRAVQKAAAQMRAGASA